MNSHDFFRKMVGMVDSVEQGKAPAQLNEAKGQFRAGSKSYFKAGQQAIKNMKADAKAKQEKNLDAVTIAQAFEWVKTNHWSKREFTEWVEYQKRKAVNASESVPK